MSYNRSFMIAKTLSKHLKADITEVSKKTLNVDADFRAHKVNDGPTTKYLLDFGTDTPQIELTIDGTDINARFLVVDS
jgi:hypothetical protein|tara:strand:+ start:79 stop:312 length:234 start_codon:yes stop_codon:yes gene_type:complete